MKKRFIFDENYIKRYTKRNQTRWLIIGLGILVILSVIMIVLLINRNNRHEPTQVAIPSFELRKEIVLESGSTLPDVLDYFSKLENLDDDDIKISYPEEFEISYNMDDCSEEELEEITGEGDIEDFECAVPILKSPTTYGITLNILEKEYTVNLVIEDTTAPVLKTKDVEILKGEKYEIEDFIDNCYDATDTCNYSYYGLDLDDDGKIIDYSGFTEPGEYKVKLIARDNYFNETEPVEANLKIVEPEKEVRMVVFDSRGGTALPATKVEDGKTIEEPDNPTREGYLFLGWYINEDRYDFSSEITSDLVLEAKWQKLETQSDNPNPGNTGKPPTPSVPTVPGVVNVTSVSLNYLQIVVDVGGSKTVGATVKPSNATNRTVTWSSSNNKIAKVDSKGVITGVKAGNATITASAGGKSATVKVIVKSNTVIPNTCQYGGVDYDTSKYTLSVRLASDKCAVNPNITYNEVASGIDYNRLVNQDYPLLNYPSKTLENAYSAKYDLVKNKAGTGLVGYQITVTVRIGTKVTQYIIKSDNSRKYLRNDFNFK